MKNHERNRLPLPDKPHDIISPFDLSGRDIWLVGGAGYLGAATGKLLAQHTGSVLCADLDHRAHEMVLREGLEGVVTPETLDAGDCEAVQRFFKERQFSFLLDMRLIQPVANMWVARCLKSKNYPRILATLESLFAEEESCLEYLSVRGIRTTPFAFIALALRLGSSRTITTLEKFKTKIEK